MRVQIDVAGSKRGVRRYIVAENFQIDLEAFFFCILSHILHHLFGVTGGDAYGDFFLFSRSLGFLLFFSAAGNSACKGESC